MRIIDPNPIADIPVQHLCIRGKQFQHLPEPQFGQQLTVRPPCKPLEHPA